MSSNFARRFRRAALTLAVLTIPAGAVRGHDFVRDSAPMKWVEQAMIEDLPPLKSPAYFEDFDKAVAQVNAGRYKTALLTIRRIKDPKPAQVLPIALAKGRALAVIG